VYCIRSVTDSSSTFKRGLNIIFAFSKSIKANILLKAYNVATIVLLSINILKSHKTKTEVNRLQYFK
jgi:hypothetical protein